MKNPIETGSLFPNEAPKPSPVTKQARLSQKYARLEMETASHLSKLEKSRARAHFIVGSIVLGDGALWNTVRAGVEAKLPTVGSARKAVDTYGSTLAQIETLRGLLGRGGNPDQSPPQSGEAPLGVPPAGP